MKIMDVNNIQNVNKAYLQQAGLLQQDGSISSSGAMFQLANMPLPSLPSNPFANPVYNGKSGGGSGGKDVYTAMVEDAIKDGLAMAGLTSPDSTKTSSTKESSSAEQGQKTENKTVARASKSAIEYLRDKAQGDTESVKFAAARAGSRSGGQCYLYVADAIEAALGQKFLSGISAYEAAPQLAKNKNFQEITDLKASDLPKLPAGYVVVWSPVEGHPHGHISISDGNGNEISDFKAPQSTTYGKNFRVFRMLPKSERA